MANAIDANSVYCNVIAFLQSRDISQLSDDCLFQALICGLCSLKETWGFRYAFNCQGTSTRSLRSDLSGLWVKLPPVITSLNNSTIDS